MVGMGDQGDHHSSCQASTGVASCKKV